MNNPVVTPGNQDRSRLWTLLLIIAVLAAVLAAGCTFPMPSSKGSSSANGQSGPWTGSYDTEWGTMTLVQNGDKVTGTYIHDDGKVVGTVSGNTLTGTWSESPSYNPPDDAGDFVLTLSADGKTITGNWRYGSNTGTWDGTWEGTRQ